MNTLIHAACVLAVTAQLGSCASLPNSDPLAVSVARIEPLPGEGMELRLAIHLRIQNPNDAAIDYSELFDETWSDAGLVFDSAVRAKGAKYVWAYRGLWSAAPTKR